MPICLFTLPGKLKTCPPFFTCHYLCKHIPSFRNCKPCCRRFPKGITQTRGSILVDHRVLRLLQPIRQSWGIIQSSLPFTVYGSHVLSWNTKSSVGSLFTTDWTPESCFGERISSLKIIHVSCVINMYWSPEIICSFGVILQPSVGTMFVQIGIL